MFFNFAKLKDKKFISLEAKMSWEYRSYYQEAVKIYRSGVKDETTEFDWSLGVRDPSSKFFVYLFEETVRTPNGLNVQTVRKSFPDFKSLHQYLAETLLENIRAENEYTDYEDLFIDSGEKELAPEPTQELINIILNPKRLFTFIEESRGGAIYDPWYSNPAYLIPQEISVFKC